jgi:hypothetical protein
VPRVGVPCGHLHVPQVDTGVEDLVTKVCRSIRSEDEDEDDRRVLIEPSTVSTQPTVRTTAR